MDFSLFSPPSRVSSTILSSTHYPVIQTTEGRKDLECIHALCSRDSSLRSDELLRTCPKNDKKKALPLSRGESSKTLELVNLSGFIATLALKKEKMKPFVEFSPKNG